ncbi:hypothetical protein RGQ29_016862 [Quercus rubra]|uniref:Transmembrane protein n=1 Tax=Quercus rubra TaxID=3512 RepID=A0AAN7FFR3_QUERU|nr:hypothetical protein RGQ29_016862 [Quercus rubra]
MATNDSGLAFKRWGRTQPFMKYGIPMISVTVFGALGYGRLLKGRTHSLSTMSGSWLACMCNTLAPKPFHLFFPFSPISLKTIEEPSKGNPPSPDANLHLT